MQLVDVFLFNDEFDLLEKRLEYLYDYVDHFVLIEGDKTFGGTDKPFYFEENKDRYAKYLNKISNFRFVSTDREINLARDPWQYEVMQRTHISFCLDSFDANDIMIIGDLDEIPNRNKLEEIKNAAYRDDIAMLQYHQYSYNLTTQSNGHGCFTAYAAKKRVALSHGPNKIRKSFSVVDAELKGEIGIGIVMDAGWHLTYFFPVEQIPEKISESCLLEYKTDYFLDIDRIQKCVDNRLDLFERLPQTYIEVDPKQIFPSDFLDIFMERL